jgi:hypothetical protein
MRSRDEASPGEPTPRVRNLEGEAILFHLGIEPPLAKGNSTSKIPTSELKFVPENGHISLIVKNRDKIVTELQHLFF